LIEALAPTLERDFYKLPLEKRKIYREIQALHMTSSPDGPWFFIIAGHDPRLKQFQLIGITDTSMLRPQVFSYLDSNVKLVSSLLKDKLLMLYLEIYMKIHAYPHYLLINIGLREEEVIQMEEHSFMFTTMKKINSNVLINLELR